MAKLTRLSLSSAVVNFSAAARKLYFWPANLQNRLHHEKNSCLNLVELNSGGYYFHYLASISIIRYYSLLSGSLLDMFILATFGFSDIKASTKTKASN